jgi:hypothetical protein
MSPLDQRFRRAVAAAFATWTDAVAKDLERGQAEGSVRRDIDAGKIASFIVATIEGSFGLAKSARSGPMVRSNLEVLESFLETLRPTRKNAQRAVKRARRKRGRA